MNYIPQVVKLAYILMDKYPFSPDTYCVEIAEFQMLPLKAQVVCYMICNITLYDTKEVDHTCIS